MRARMRARSIWREKYADCYDSRQNAHHVKRGFIDGFVDTALGGKGCPPLIAPQYCFSSKSPMAGHAWFEGFPLGVVSAESVGADRWSRTIVLSPHLTACFANQGCNAGCVPCGRAASQCGCGQTACNGDCGQPAIVAQNQVIQSGMLDQDGALIIDHSVAPTPVPVTEPNSADGGNEEVPEAPALSVTPSADSDDDEDFSSVVPIAPQKTEAVPGPSPAITGPVEMPNLQVRYDANLSDAGFSTGIIAQALLELDGADGWAAQTQTNATR